MEAASAPPKAPALRQRSPQACGKNPVIMPTPPIAHRLPRTVTFRLTLWYCAVYALLALGVFGLTNAILSMNLRRRARKDAADELAEFTELYRRQGIARLQSEFDREAGSNGVDSEYLALYTPDLRVRAQSDPHRWQAPQVPPRPGRWPGERVFFRTLELPGFQAPVLAAARKLPDGAVLQIVTSLEADARLLRLYREMFALGGGAMLVAGSVLGWVYARRAMAGVERVTRTARRIGAGDLGRRVPVGNEGEEIRSMAEAFNQMLERIEKLVAELREVSNNIAHDLRSPLTRIRGQVESMFRESNSVEECRAFAGTVIEECDRMAALIDTMLDIAEAETGAARMARQPLDLAALLEDACELFRPVAEDAGVDLQLALPNPDAPITAMADPAKLQRVVANLIDNAVKFTPAGGAVRVAAEQIGRSVHVSVHDTGIGIAPDEIGRVFDRFYRSDRSRSTPGNGLGLSLVRAIVEAHGGQVAVVSRPGEGSTFTVQLPLAPIAPEPPAPQNREW